MLDLFVSVKLENSHWFRLVGDPKEMCYHLRLIRCLTRSTGHLYWQKIPEKLALAPETKVAVQRKIRVQDRTFGQQD